MLHRHASHNEAVARISWCINERTIGVVTGEVGAGKTVSVRTALTSLDPSKHTVIYLPNPLIGVRGIHEQIVGTLGQPAAHLGSRLTVQASKTLTAEREERGRTPVLVLDEAHLLTYELLETIRMLTNQSMDQDSRLACLLVGPVHHPLHPSAVVSRRRAAPDGNATTGLHPNVADPRMPRPRPGRLTAPVTS